MHGGGTRLRRTRSERYVWLAFAGAGLLTAGACRKPRDPFPTLVIAHEITPWPPRIGRSTVAFQLTDSAKKVTGAIVKLEADMSHPGMRPEFGEAREAAPGRYQGQLTFSMAGDWVVLLHITLPDGQTLERQVEVNGVRPN